MMRPLVIRCESTALAAALHPARGARGALIVSGGVQTRAGPHRLFTRLAEALAARGAPTLRFDRRGVGDSEGGDAGFLGSEADIAAAAAALRREGGADGTTGIGLCDGAAALALFGAGAGIDRLVLINPWSFDGAVAEMPAAAQRERTARRLRSPGAWLRVLTGQVDIVGALRSVFARPEPTTEQKLAARLVAALNAFQGPVLVVLSRSDATARAFGELLPRLGAHVRTRWIENADHTFTRPEAQEALLAAIGDSLKD